MSYVNFNMISSGSKGNSTLIWDQENLVVIDFGISLRRFRERLRENRIGKLDVSLFVSHEHSDHSSGVRLLDRNMPVNIYTRELTGMKLGLRDSFAIKESVVFGNFEVTAFSVSHDAVDPVAYTVRCGKAKMSVVSDLGVLTDEICENIKDSDILALEANHDEQMLINGTYSSWLKKRILSGHGHLSNKQTAEYISRLVKPETRLILTHLSQENNRPEIALREVQGAISQSLVQCSHIECASQQFGSSLFTLATD